MESPDFPRRLSGIYYNGTRNRRIMALTALGLNDDEIAKLTMTKPGCMRSVRQSFVEVWDAVSVLHAVMIALGKGYLDVDRDAGSKCPKRARQQWGVTTKALCENPLDPAHCTLLLSTVKLDKRRLLVEWHNPEPDTPMDLILTQAKTSLTGGPAFYLVVSAATSLQQLSYKHVVRR